MLYIVRHAWAGHFGDPDYPDDRLRPLTEEGRERFCQMVDILLVGAASAALSSVIMFYSESIVQQPWPWGVYLLLVLGVEGASMIKEWLAAQF